MNTTPAILDDTLAASDLDARVLAALSSAPARKRKTLEEVRDRVGLVFCSTVSHSMDRLHAAGRINSAGRPVVA